MCLPGQWPSRGGGRGPLVLLSSVPEEDVGGPGVRRQGRGGAPGPPCSRPQGRLGLCFSSTDRDQGWAGSPEGWAWASTWALPSSHRGSHSRQIPGAAVSDGANDRAGLLRG